MKRFLGIFITGLLLLTLCGCDSGAVRVQTATDVVMGTVVTIKLYTTESEDLTGELLALLGRLEEDELSRRLPSSEVYRLNSSEHGREQQVSEGLGKTLERCAKIGTASGGALDITMGAVVQLWDIDHYADCPEEFMRPEKSEIAQALSTCGWEKISLSESAQSITLEPNTVLDLGAVGKGIALDRILAYLEGKPAVSGAVISVGGSVLTYGCKPDNSAWRIGITDPFDTSDVCGYLLLEGTKCVSTSGNYERYVEVDGVHYHHILDPKTGEPVQNGLASVTIVSSDGFLSDALSTACYVTGEEKGLKLTERYGCQAMFVSEDGLLRMTEGFRQLFEPK